MKRMAQTSESPYKARFCAQMMAAAAVLAAGGPDDFHRRILARPVFVYCHEFIRWARRAKNELKKAESQRELIRDLDEALADLEKRDFGPYEGIRHRIAAHRQPFSVDDVASNLLDGYAAWNDITDAAVRILAEDAREVWNLLADAYALPRLERFPPISSDLHEALQLRGFAPAPEGLRVGVGSFDATRPDAAAITQGGELGDRVRDIVDAVRNVQVLSQVWQVVNGHEPFWRVVASATITEACTLVDLVYVQPPSTKPEHRHPPLLELLRRDEPDPPALAYVEEGLAALDRVGLEHLRRLRDTIGAHVDDQRAVTELMRDLEGFDPDALNAAIDNVFGVLSAARAADLRLANLRLIESTMAGLSRADGGEEIRPYD